MIRVVSIAENFFQVDGERAQIGGRLFQIDRRTECAKLPAFATQLCARDGEMQAARMGRDARKPVLWAERLDGDVALKQHVVNLQRAGCRSPGAARVTVGNTSSFAAMT
jgi:hypothetical protein